MATDAGSIFVRITSETAGFESGMARVNARISSAERAFGSLAKAAKVATLAMVGIGAVVGYEVVKAAMNAEKATAKLSIAFRDSGLSAEKYGKQIEQADAAGRKLGFANDQTKGALAKLVVATGDAGKAFADLSTAQDIARFKNIDLVSASQMLAMAMTGSQRAVKALGIVVSPVTTNMDALKASHVNLTTVSGKLLEAHTKLLDKYATGDAIIAKVNEKLHGQAAIFAGTLAGKWETFRANITDASERIGVLLLPALSGILTVASSAISGALGWFGKLRDEMGKQHTFAGKLRVIWTNVRETATDLAGRLADYFWRGWTVKIGGVEGGGHAKNALTNFHKGMLSGLSSIDWGGVGKAILKGIGSGLAGAGKLSLQLIGFISDTMNKVDWGSVGIKLGPALAGAIAGGFVALLDPGFWAQHWQLAIAVAIAAFPIGKLAGLGTKVGAELSGAFARGLLDVLGVIERVSPRVASALLTAFEGAARVAGAALIAALERLGSLLTALVTRIFGRLSKVAVFIVKVLGIEAVISTLASLAVSAYNKAKEIGSKIVGGIWSGVSRVGEVIWNAIKKIWSVLTSAVSTAEGAGRRIGEAIPRGIWSAFSGAIGWLKGKIEGALGFLKSLNPFSSVEHGGFLYIGMPIIKGAARAITEGMGQVASALSGGLRDGVMGPGVQAAIAAASRTLGVNVVDKIVQGIVGKQQSIADQIKQALTDAVKQAIQAAAQAVTAARGTLLSAFQGLASAATSAFDSVHGGSAKTRALGKKLTAEQQAQKDKQDAVAAAARDQTLADAQTKLSEDIKVGPTSGETEADFQKRIAADQKAVADAVQAIQDAKDQAQIDADTKSLAAAQKRDKDNFEKQWAKLQAEVKAHPERAAKIKAEIDKLLERYGITPASVMAATDWNTSQTLFVSSIGDMVTAMKALTTAIEKQAGLSTPATAWTSHAVGGPTKTGLALLHDNEYVLRAAATRKIGIPALDRLNKYGSFQDGGPVEYVLGPAPPPGLLPPLGPGQKINPITGLPDVPAFRAAAMYLNDAGRDKNETPILTALIGALGPRAQTQASMRATTTFDGFPLRRGLWRNTGGVVDSKMIELWSKAFPGITFEPGSPGLQISWGSAASRLPMGGQELGGLIQNAFASGKKPGSLLEHVTSHAVHFGKGGIALTPQLAMVAEKGPEAMLPLNLLKSMGGGVIENTTIIQLDGKEIARDTRRRAIEDHRAGRPWQLPTGYR